jgi:hypothetical protein
VKVKRRQARPGQERLERWQAWQFSGGWHVCAFYIERVDNCYVLGDGLSANDAEAMITDRFVTQLPKHILRTVKVYYLDRIGNSREGYAARLRISVSTLDRHLETAYTLIEGMWDDHLIAARKNNFVSNEKHA